MQFSSSSSSPLILVSSWNHHFQREENEEVKPTGELKEIKLLQRIRNEWVSFQDFPSLYGRANEMSMRDVSRWERRKNLPFSFTSFGEGKIILIILISFHSPPCSLLVWYEQSKRWGAYTSGETRQTLERFVEMEKKTCIFPLSLFKRKMEKGGDLLLLFE